MNIKVNEPKQILRMERLGDLVFGQWFRNNGHIGMMIEPGNYCKIMWISSDNKIFTYNDAISPDITVECLSVTDIYFKPVYLKYG